MTFLFSSACRVGTYRSSRDTTCLSCPANTLTNEMATGQCQCQIGYFRNNVTVDRTCSSYLSASNERAGNQCTRKKLDHLKCMQDHGQLSFSLFSEPPSAPYNVTVSAMSPRSIIIHWTHLSLFGGRSDLYYTVQYSNPEKLGEFIGTTCKKSSSTEHILSTLRPDTQYCIRMTAHNGVSDQDPNGVNRRTEESCTTTPEEGK